MRYVRHYKQQTIKTSDPREFDDFMNEIFMRAAQSGKEPEVHFFENQDFCATVRYFVNLNIPETISEQYEVRGETHQCQECPKYVPITDRRRTTSLCECGKKRCPDSKACDMFYHMLEGGMLYAPNENTSKQIK